MDRHSKKGIMLTADSLAAVCSVVVLVLSGTNCLQIWHIYLVNAVLGFMNAFQGPASSVAVGKMVPKELLANVSGMNSFAEKLVTVFAPMLAAVLFSIGGLPLILAVDLISFLAAFLVLLLWIKLPENFENVESCKESGIFSGCRDGFVFLREHKGILMIVITMSLLNFFSRLTYENILSPMILARSDGDSVSLGIVNAVMGMGRNVFVWSVAAAAASLPIPFICAGQNVILYRDVPEEMQGRPGKRNGSDVPLHWNLWESVQLSGLPQPGNPEIEVIKSKKWKHAMDAVFAAECEEVSCRQSFLIWTERCWIQRNIIGFSGQRRWRLLDIR